MAEIDDYQIVMHPIDGEQVGYRRLSDGAIIPLDEGNADYQRLKMAMDDGYTPLPAEETP